MKNPHGVEPTRYMKREESDCAINCDPDYGPIFCGSDDYCDICIIDNCNEEVSCSINNNGNSGYECHPQYKKSLFVNISKPDNWNRFSVLDYEVFVIDYKKKYTIDHLCKYPAVIWEYIKTEDISEKSLKHVGDEDELLDDLDAIHCNDSNLRLKIAQYCPKKFSIFLPNTQLVYQKHDDKLREWCGDYKWKLIYRASEHEYTAKSFHECCDDKGPTLIVIKSNGGDIFGGYTTQSWKVIHPNEFGGIY